MKGSVIMKCPFCGNEMEQGYLQSGHIILWTDRRHKVSTKPRGDKDFAIAKNALGGANTVGMNCRKCKKIIIEY